MVINTLFNGTHKYAQKFSCNYSYGTHKYTCKVKVNDPQAVTIPEGVVGGGGAAPGNYLVF